MAKIYLSTSTPRGSLVRVLSFERGQPIAEFSVGRRGIWRTSARGVADRHLWVSFDGQCIVLRRDSAGDPVRVNGRPLQLSPERIVGLPCRIEFGGARLLVDDRKPPVPALDAGVLRRSESASVDTEHSGTRMLETQIFDRRMFDDLETNGGSSARIDAHVARPARDERMVDAGCATSVMPLETLLQRGFTVSAPEEDRHSGPHERRRERRRERRSRAREPSPGGRGQLPVQRWLAALRARGVIVPRQKGLLALGLLVPLVGLLCHELLPEASGSSVGGRAPAGRAFDETVALGTDDERSARRATLSLGDGAKDSAPLIAMQPLHDSAASAMDNEARGLAATALSLGTAPQLVDDAASGPTSERQAVDALATSDSARARALYAMLAHRAPENGAFAEAARILGVDLNAPANARVGSILHEERLTDGLTAAVR